MSYKTEVLTFNDPKFYSNACQFATWAEADAYGTDLSNRWTMVEKMQVIESSEPVNYVWQNGKLARVPSPPRRHRVEGCPSCAADGTEGPSHDASERCESGKYPHCSCDLCF